MKFNGPKNKLEKLFVEAFPNGSSDEFPQGVRYRMPQGAVITWWATTGSVAVQGKKEVRAKAIERLDSFLNSSASKPHAVYFNETQEASAMPHPGLRAKYKIPINSPSWPRKVR
ncbi:hypothetical protein [Aestuariivirga sp.]|uniref:hypothetical protein n=1 Tax=Aestuariivirga sp. TaxID=2650926 RepID=UPI0039E64086